MPTLLILVTWLQTAPLVTAETLPSLHACTVAANVAEASMKGQALTNMTGPHRDLTARGDLLGEGRILVTGGIGREVARIRCVPLVPG